MNRAVEPELLDELPATDPRAIRSRRDLRLLNRLMGNHRPICKMLRKVRDKEHITIAEMGAGEGLLSLSLARTLGGSGRVFLVDRQPAVREGLEDAFARVGWKAEVVAADVFGWLNSAKDLDAIVCSLFLHHFKGDQLEEMFRLIAKRTRIFAAAEPLRDRVAHLAAKNLWLIGCNEVTCHDGEISVRAGFNGAELSGYWKGGAEWILTEKRAGLFTHFFTAELPR